MTWFSDRWSYLAKIILLVYGRKKFFYVALNIFLFFEDVSSESTNWSSTNIEPSKSFHEPRILFRLHRISSMSHLSTYQWINKNLSKTQQQTDCKRIIHTHDILLSFDLLHTTHISFFFPLLITDQSNIADPNCLPSSCHFPVQPGADTFFRIKLDNALGWPAALLVLTIGAIGYTKKT